MERRRERREGRKEGRKPTSVAGGQWGINAKTGKQSRDWKILRRFCFWKTSSQTPASWKQLRMNCQRSQRRLQPICSGFGSSVEPRGHDDPWPRGEPRYQNRSRCFRLSPVLPPSPADPPTPWRPHPPPRIVRRPTNWHSSRLAGIRLNFINPCTKDGPGGKGSSGRTLSAGIWKRNRRGPIRGTSRNRVPRGPLSFFRGIWVKGKKPPLNRG